MNQVFNFSSGPAMLPKEVLLHAKQEFCNWNGLGSSVMEISHRSKEFIEIAKESEQDLRDLLCIPDYYKVLFCQGGARAQFSAVPLNLLKKNNAADYVNSGYWARSAINEATKYCKPNIIDVIIEEGGLRGILPMKQWNLSDDSDYIHYCPNETVDGLSINEQPNFGNKVVVADFSSTILSQPINVTNFGVIYAGGQKNIGPAGITLVIVREDLIGYAKKELPSILNYQILSENNSMFNTPPTFSWYLSGLVFKWLKSQGGLIKINQRNKAKAELLYRTINTNSFYKNNILLNNRSNMNVTFHLRDFKLNSLFIKESLASDLHALQGHRAVGGMRASIYNAMPLSGVQALVDFMKEFSFRHG